MFFNTVTISFYEKLIVLQFEKPVFQQDTSMQEYR